MKTPLIVLAVIVALMSGCVPIVKQFAPSLEHCDEVQYYRKGSQFSVMANCRL